MLRQHRLAPLGGRLLGGLLVVVLLGASLLALPLVAQPHPAIPEERCPLARLELVPRTDGTRGMGLRVRNVDPGDFGVRLGREISVEREVEGRWQRVSVAGLWLRDRCEGSSPESITLPRDASLTIVPWTGMQGDAQCVCTRCAPAPAGRYRFAVTSAYCQHPRTTYSEPFTLPPP